MISSDTHDVLFVCGGQAGLSLVASALFNRLSCGRVRPRAAVLETNGSLNPTAARLMLARGLALACEDVVNVHALPGLAFDVVVTIGDAAAAHTPAMAGNPRWLYWDLPDPEPGGDTSEGDANFQQAIEMIEHWLPGLLDILRECKTARALHHQPGFSTSGLSPLCFDPALHVPKIAKAGFRCIELSCYSGSADFQWDHRGRVRELARIAHAEGVQIFSVHAEQSLMQDTGPGLRSARDVGMDFSDLAAELGAQTVVFHACLAPGMNHGEGWANLRDTLATLQEHVLPMPCRFGLENGVGLATGEFLDLVHSLNPGAFGLVLDTGHALIEKNLDPILSRAGLTLCGVHIDDNDAQSDQHKLPGEGVFQWKGFAARLAACGYIGPLMLESKRPDGVDVDDFLAQSFESLRLLA